MENGLVVGGSCRVMDAVGGFLLSVGRVVGSILKSKGSEGIARLVWESGKNRHVREIVSVLIMERARRSIEEVPITGLNMVIKRLDVESMVRDGGRLELRLGGMSLEVRSQIRHGKRIVEGGLFVTEDIEGRAPMAVDRAGSGPHLIIVILQRDVGSVQECLASRMEALASSVAIHVMERLTEITAWPRGRGIHRHRAAIVGRHTRNLAFLFEGSVRSPDHLDRLDIKRICLELLQDGTVLLLIALASHLWGSGVKDVHARPVNALQFGTIGILVVLRRIKVAVMHETPIAIAMLGCLTEGIEIISAVAHVAND
jgi:hypothetical protein